MKTHKDNFSHTIHIIRAIVILLIVFQHANTYLLESKSVMKSTLNTGMYLALSNTSILFVITSGYLFYHLSYKFHMSRFYVSKFKTLVLPYLFMSSFVYSITSYLNIPNVIVPINNAPPNVQYEYLETLLFGYAIAPYWYMPMIIGIYLISPILLKMAKYDFFIWITLSLISLSLFFNINRWSLINSIIYYLPLFMLGMTISKHNFLFRKFLSGYFGNAVFPIFIFFFIMNYNIKSGFDFSKLQQIFLFLIFYKLFLNYRFNKSRISLVVNVISNYSFSIYFIHEIIDIKVWCNFLMAKGYPVIDNFLFIFL